MQKAMGDLAALLGADTAATLDALRQAGDASRASRDLGREKLDDLTAAVRRNPFGWLAAAAGAGLVVGLWRNRRRS